MTLNYKILSYKWYNSGISFLRISCNIAVYFQEIFPGNYVLFLFTGSENLTFWATSQFCYFSLSFQEKQRNYRNHNGHSKILPFVYSKLDLRFIVRITQTLDCYLSFLFIDFVFEANVFKFSRLFISRVDVSLNSAY